MVSKFKVGKPDYVFVALGGLLLVFGLVMLASASSPVGFERFDDSYHFLKKQVLHGLIPGLLLGLIASYIPYQKWLKWWRVFLIVTILLLVSVFIPQIAASYGASKSWVSFGPISFQPAEIAKVTFILGLSGWFASNKESIKYCFFPFLLVVGLVAGLLAIQPDVGTMVIFVLIAGVIFFVAGGHWRQITSLVLLSIATVAALVLSAPYRLSRFLTFLNPGEDIRGIGYQLNQALIAIGSGGLFGLGLGHSRQKFLYLPEVTSDSIFAIIGEEMGFVVVVMFLIALTIFFLKGLSIGKRSGDYFARLIVSGVVSWIMLQSLINIGATIGILPLTGVPLPFVSHGGTALMSMLVALGIMVNISRKST